MKRWLPGVATVCAVATICVVATMVLIGGAPPAAAAPTAGPAAVKQIAYTRDDTNGIWLVNADGTANHKISTAPAGAVSFAPDGKHLAYSASGEIWTMPVSGGTARRLTHTGGTAYDAAWSPNGKWIAFTAPAGTGTDIYRVPAAGGNAARLTYGGRHGCRASTPAWSPDSTTIAYVRYDGYPASCPAGGLVVQHLGETARIVLAGPVRSGSFTPAGNLAYLAPCDDPDLCYSGDWVSYEANADGTGPVIVDYRDDCMEGDLCQQGITGAARVHGWVIASTYADEEGDTSETCFQGGYQQAGMVLDMPPTLCLRNVLSTVFDVF